MLDPFSDHNADENQNREDDKAKILSTSFKTELEEPALATNSMTTFANPVYGSGLSPSSDTESEIIKEDLAMIGKPIYEEDIEL